jgi:predicted nucleic acid-binding protein
MKTVFADANYWVAILNPRDTLHDTAKRVSRSVGQSRIVTSEFVLLEVMKLMANAGLHLKQVAHRAIGDMRRNPNLKVVPATSTLFQKACERYVAYHDKEWDAIDCSCMIIMEEEGVSEALTYDKHFQQMGFTALLREHD